MKTRRIIIVFCVFTLALSQEKIEGKSKVLSTYRDRTPKGKYDPVDIEDSTSFEVDELMTSANDGSSNAQHKRMISKYPNGSFMGQSDHDMSAKDARMGEKTSPKSGQWPTSANMPRSTLKSRERAKNVTIGNGICQTADIRNDVENFWILKDCEVIEGNLQIVLIQKNHEKDFENLSFPKLKEITGYLLLYRVNALKNLTNLFPNLEVIRGNTLMTDYALVIYEMPHLQEIGLQKLIRILRGGVRIELNPKLCFVKTVNWDRILYTATDNFFKDNSKEEACPSCSHCKEGNCWTSKICQELEKPNCHYQCMGHCDGPTERSCYVCKHFRHEGKCVDKCPPNLYEYISRRCLTKEECLDLNVQKNDHTTAHWRPFKGQCRENCPEGYEDNGVNNMTRRVDIMSTRKRTASWSRTGSKLSS